MNGTQASSRRWFGLVFISIAVSLIIVDSTIVNVAIPSIVDELQISSTQVQWVQEVYTLVFAALLLVFGSLADRFGRRRTMLIGVVIFATSSVAAALATSGELLILARFVQGVGGAMILPTTLSLINATFRGRERGIAFAVWGSTIGGMAALGPLLGGWLTTEFSWRWAFGINVPLGILIIVGVLLTVDESKEGTRRRVDAVGALLSVLTSAALVFGLIEGRSLGWWTTNEPLTIGAWTWPWELSPVPLAFVVSAGGLIAFIAWGRHRMRTGRSTLIAFGLFRIPSFRNGNIAALVVSLGEFGIILSLPLWLQFVIGFDALQTGLVLLALAIGSFVASGFAGAFSNRIAPVTIVRLGLIAEIVGVAGLALVISPSTQWAALIPFLFVYGFGVGLATAQLTGVVLGDVPVEQSGQGSGTQSTARQLGSALGIAVLGTVLFTSTALLLGASLDARGVPADQRDQVVSAVVDTAGGAIAGLEADPSTSDLADEAKAAFSTGTQYAAFAAAGFLVLGLAATFSLGQRRRGDRPSDILSKDNELG
ncbi:MULTISPECIES: DHA2 family efflux MFS transporter permease subunit [unclassified Microbacterium]|uniref:DHA2 family efflux MFS transporter permease subunit n=1 Tax=unclassified Microbacterium TaxID=2609290 RepID=UPI00214D0494|nr:MULTISPECIES: DHA2 family efflux MFS transporter permease subunit [unclassified Microbacterium]MCR2808605.1 DHA2 family efflux MFS transporter permease subunit [Microbacterium sp. zg.B185]WIM18961.1 DHA2 family efflux MFS transporter permease subunit [Microbacterium sp. zg-B185]